MIDEEEKVQEEKKEEITEEENIDNTVATAVFDEENTEESTEETISDEGIGDEEEPQEEQINIDECDPLTMNCNEMPQVMHELIRKEETIQSDIGHIENLQHNYPEREELIKLSEEMNQEKKKIHEKISQITERFSACKLVENKKE